MPFVDGESLRARLDREKQLPIDEAVRISVAVANALDYAHSHHVIHRDLKPENILLQAGQPVVADFGIALAVSKAGGSRVTQTGLSLGTPQYMSPEQATGDRVIDGRTDIYSLGALTYEMLTGEPPHIGQSAQAVIARLLTDKPRSVRSMRSAVPEHVDAAVAHALEKLPADRFTTAREFAEALQGRGGITVSTRSSAPAVRSFPDRISRIIVSAEGAQEIVWSDDGKTIYYRSGSALLTATVEYAPFRVVRRDTLLTTQMPTASIFGSSYDVARDGRIVTLFSNRDNFELVVAPNWITEFRQRIAASERSNLR
jgi:eukaryotic-like serine/threonine-protein kinase